MTGETSTEQARELLERYIAEVWDAGDPAAVERFAADSYRRHTSPQSEPLDMDQQIERLKGFREAFPDISIEVENMVTDGHLLAFRSTMRGTHRGEFFGIAATGREVTVNLVDMVRIEDGRFVEQWGGPDMLDLARQLGARFES
jgi:steroid delta-isomerase-like uncharacterized protein